MVAPDAILNTQTEGYPHTVAKAMFLFDQPA